MTDIETLRAIAFWSCVTVGMHPLWLRNLFGDAAETELVTAYLQGVLAMWARASGVPGMPAFAAINAATDAVRDLRVELAVAGRLERAA